MFVYRHHRRMTYLVLHPNGDQFASDDVLDCVSKMRTWGLGSIVIRHADGKVISAMVDSKEYHVKRKFFEQYNDTRGQ